MLLYHFSHGSNLLYNIEMTQCIILHCVYSAGEARPSFKTSACANTKASYIGI